jgi:hypothetical protein
MSVIAEYLVSGASPATVGGLGTGILYFADLPGRPGWNSGATGVNTAIDNLQQGVVPTSVAPAGGLPVPGRNILNGQRFEIMASGNIVFGATEASTTGLVTIYYNLGGTDVTWHTLNSQTLTNQAQDSVYYPWHISSVLEGDTLSGLLQSYKSPSGMFNGTAQAAATTAISGVNFAQEPAFSVAVGVTFGASNANNSANLYQFQVNLF